VKRIATALLAGVCLVLTGLTPASAAWEWGVPQQAAQRTYPVVKPPQTAQLPASHDAGECTHGCWAEPTVCIIIATTWGPIQTMWARWWAASNSVIAEFRSPGAGCNDYPGSRRWTFSAFNDPNYNNCWKWQGTTRAADGHWNNHIVVYMNWGIPSCRTDQIEIEHRTGAAIGWIGGTPIWTSTSEPWKSCINNMTEWSIANVNYVTTWCGSWWQQIYGVST
jgi:hypothetical protein